MFQQEKALSSNNKLQNFNRFRKEIKIVYIADVIGQLSVSTERWGKSTYAHSRTQNDGSTVSTRPSVISAKGKGCGQTLPNIDTHHFHSQ